MKFFLSSHTISVGNGVLTGVFAPERKSPLLDPLELSFVTRKLLSFS